MNYTLLLILYIFFGRYLFSFTNLTIAIYVPVVVTIFAYLLNRIYHFGEKRQFKYENRIIACVIIETVILLILHQFDKVSSLYCGFLSSALLFIIIQSNINIKMVRRLSLIFLLIYVFNLLIAYYERMTLQNLFYDANRVFWDEDYYNVGLDYIFRSTGLLGHPLNNAYATGLMMCTILLLNLKVFYKYALWFMGLIGLFCFNARGAILVSITMLGIYILYKLSSKFSFKHIILSVVVISAFIYIMNSILASSLAGRLVVGEIMDGSAQTRLQIWEPILYANFGELMFGYSPHRYEQVALSIGLHTAENWLAIFIYKIGVPMTAIILYSFFRVYKNSISYAPKFDRFFMAIAFIGFASLNNSLAISSFPWLIAYLLFVIVNGQRFINSKTFMK